MTTLVAVLNWRPKTPFFYGWLVLGTSASGAFVATSIAGVVLGGIQNFIFEDTGWSRSTVGFAATAGVWGSGLLAPFIGRLADRYGPRWLMPLGVFILGLCLLSLGGTSSVWQFYLAAILGRAISQPLLIGVVPRTLAVNFFQRKRSTALALTGMFRPISSAIIIQFVAVIAVAYGWRTSFLYLGILSIFITLPMILIIRRRPEDVGLLPDGAKAEEQLPVRGSGGSSGSSGRGPGRLVPGESPYQERSWTAREALGSRAFWLVALTTFLVVTGSSAIGFNMVPYLHEEANISITQAAGALSVSTFLALTGLGWGYLADRFTPRWCMVGAMLSAAGIILYLLTVNSLLSAYVFSVLWGVFQSSLEVLVYTLLAGYFGRASYGAIAGALRPFEAGGLGLGQLLGPVIYDMTGSYTGLIVASVGFYLLGVLLILLARTPERGHDRKAA
jgi:sugar phosphate permease